jgi:hypothetical protein
MVNVAATCATIAGILANPAAPTKIVLTGDCPSIDITRTYSPAITIDASKATVRGLRIVGGGGVIWIGGILRSKDGEGVGGPAGYGALVRSANDVIIDGVRFIDSKKALVVDKTNNFIVRNSRFEIGEDAVIASAGSNLEFSKNTVVKVTMRQTECQQAEKIEYGLPRRVCEALGGVWTDGWHQDAFQFRDGIKGLKITGNVVRNAQQGIGQMDAKNDAPVSDVLIDGNDVEVTGFHSITMNVASNVRITNNRVRQMTGRRTIIRPGVGAIVCGNDVQRPGDPGAERCK